MKLKTTVYAALAPIGLALLVTLAACARKPEEQRLREAIAAMQRAVEGGRPRDFMAHVAADFVGQDGNLERSGLANLLRIEVLRNDKIGVTLGPIDVEIRGDRATVHVVATLTGGSGGLLPERGAIYSIASGWKREGASWLCYNAIWTQHL